MNGAGLYIHVPFCRRRCTYCDFYSEGDALARLPLYMRALTREAALRKTQLEGHAIETVYLGGGTPSLISSGELESLMARLRGLYDIREDAEITLEANPGALDLADLDAWRDLGINRLSLGIQSFDGGMLALMGRLHTAEEAAAAVAAAQQAGFGRIGLDLIYGLPGQNEAQWADDLERAIALAPGHVSAYALTWSNSTPLGRRIESGALPRPQEDAVARLYDLADRMLTRAGYVHYEVSNYALPGQESRHNQGYWTGKPYLGLGPSAHGFSSNRRYWNAASLDGYVDALNEDRLPPGGDEVLDAGQRRIEDIALGLRHLGGVSAEWLHDHEATVRRFVDQGWLTEQDGRFIPTAQGMLRADGMADALI